MRGFSRILPFLLLANSAFAQTGAHWGMQGDYFRGTLPGFIVDLIPDLPEKPDVTSKSWNAGLVRFHDNGSPNWALQFNKTQFSIDGSLTTSTTQTHVAGSGNMRGVMFSKYINFFSTKHVSAGLMTGSGIASTQASYIRTTPLPTGAVIIGGDSFDHWTPNFQLAAQADFRPVRWISLSPFYGMRNATIGFGGAIRIHFTR